jgi:hypothetical protein
MLIQIIIASNDIWNMSMIYFGVSLPCFKLSCQVFKEASILGFTYFSCSVTVLIIRQTDSSIKQDAKKILAKVVN